MSTSGPNIATVGSSVSGSGIAWVNPNYVGSTSSYATNTTTISNTVANPLNATGFDFAIPSSAIIDGIVVTYNRYMATGVTGDSTLYLLKAGTVAGTGKFDGIWPTSTAAIATFGSSNDLWGATLTPSDINNSNFGVQIDFAVTHGDFGQVNVNDVTITVYWHTAPALVNYRALYQVFDSKGNYLGLLPNVSSEFTYSQDINTSGTQTTIECAVSSDTAPTPVTTIDTETGIAITDESGNDLYTERQPDIVGDSNSNILFKNGNKVKIYEVGYYYPNGKLRFSGEISRIEANIGSGNDTIKLVIYSDGADMNNQIITGGATLDQSQTSQNASIAIYTETGKLNSFQNVGQTFIIGTGITNLAAITIMVNTGGVTMPITVSVSDTPGSAVLTSVTQNVNTSSPTAVQFFLQPAITVTAGQSLFFGVSCNNSTGATIYYDNANPYTSGAMYEQSYGGGGGGGGWTEEASYDLYFQTFYGGDETTVSYSNYGLEAMVLDIIDRYNSKGGLITASSATVPSDSGLTITYDFVVSTVLEGIQEALALAPAAYFWTVDLATDVLTFLPNDQATQHTLIKGQHISNINMVLTIENIVNTLFFSGGIASTGVPSAGSTNIYSMYQNAASVAAFGQRIDRQSDNQVTVQATADAIGNSAVANTGPEQYQTQVEIPYPNFDITLFKPGDICNFAGFGNYIDKLSLQVVRVDYKPASVVLTLGLMQPRQQLQVQQILDGLIAQETQYNGSTPTA